MRKKDIGRRQSTPENSPMATGRYVERTPKSCMNKLPYTKIGETSNFAEVKPRPGLPSPTSLAARHPSASKTGCPQARRVEFSFYILVDRWFRKASLTCWWPKLSLNPGSFEHNTGSEAALGKWVRGCMLQSLKQTITNVILRARRPSQVLG